MVKTNFWTEVDTSNFAVWPVPYACAQPYHQGSGSHGHVIIHLLGNYQLHFLFLCHITHLIIRCKCFFLFIGREPTTWPVNNCLQIMVCSCAMSFDCLAANAILLMRKWNHACSLFVYAISHYSWKAARANRFPKILSIKKRTQGSNDKTTQNIVICLLATDKSRYFAQPRPINTPYSTV